MANKRRRKKKRKVRFKKRFYFFCLLAVVIIVALVFFGIRGIVHIVSGDKAGDNVVEQVETDNIKSMEDLLAVQSAKMIPSEDDENADTPEGELVDSVLNSYYITNLGKTREEIEEHYGKLVRSEEWNGTIYYHKGFSDTMYVTYKGSLGKDNYPVMEAECTSLSIAWSYIKKFDSFIPNKSLWGTVHVDDNSLDEGYFYSIQIKDDVKLIAYCDKDGKITEDSHIIMSLF